MKSFDIRFNFTQFAQGFQPSTQQTDQYISLPLNCAIDINTLQGGYDNLTPVHSFLHEINKKAIKRFYIQRSFNFGDVLQAIALVFYLKSIGYDVYMKTGIENHKLLSLLGVEAERIDVENDDYGIILDWTLERDRLDEVRNNMHRLFIMAETLGIEGLRDIKWQWPCDLSKFPSRIFQDEVFDKENYIVFQGRGTKDLRILPEKTIDFLIKTMNDDGVRVIYIGEPIDLAGMNPAMTRLEFLQSTKEELFWVIGRAKCLITMDSFPLWVSHYAKTPTIALLGPTRPEQRTILHPLYPEGMISVGLNELVGCESCIDRPNKCEWRIDCLKVEPSRIYNLFRKNLLNFWRN